jgi:hypothetical protein
MKPPMKSSGVVKRGVPVSNVVSQAKIWIVARDHDDASRAREEDERDRRQPVANMWCAQTPKPMNATSSSAIATSGNATIRRRANVGMIDVAIPNAGRMMM